MFQSEKSQMASKSSSEGDLDLNKYIIDFNKDMINMVVLDEEPR